jgi:hypothetical protein
MMSLTDLPLYFWGHALETTSFTLNRNHLNPLKQRRTGYGMARSLGCCFLKFGDVMLMKKGCNLTCWNPKRKQLGTLSTTSPKAKTFVAKNGTSLEKEFLSKEVSGRKLELNKVTEPSLVVQCGATLENVPVAPSTSIEEANSNDDESLDEAPTELCMPRRSCSTRDLYGNHVLSIMLFDND